jgi:hypothetical protein
MAEPAELFGIVVVGNMNPRIHHPAWYEAVGILSSEESFFDKDRPLTCTPMFSQFQLADFAVSCSEVRWEIQTQDPKKLERILDFTGRAFDVLKHTPITAFGLNFHFVRPTGLQDVGKRLAELVNALPLRHKPTADDSAAVVTTTTLLDRRRLETISGVAEAPGHVSVAFNVEHPIRFLTTGKPGLKFFELTPLLRAAFDEDFPECQERAEQVAKALASIHKE